MQLFGILFYFFSFKTGKIRLLSLLLKKKQVKALSISFYHFASHRFFYPKRFLMLKLKAKTTKEQ